MAELNYSTPSRLKLKKASLRVFSKRYKQFLIVQYYSSKNYLLNIDFNVSNYFYFFKFSNSKTCNCFTTTLEVDCLLLLLSSYIYISVSQMVRRKG